MVKVISAAKKDLKDHRLDSALNALTNMQEFEAQSKFKQATFSFIAAQCLSKAEKEGIDKIFRALDTNGDG